MTEAEEPRERIAQSIIDADEEEEEEEDFLVLYRECAMEDIDQDIESMEREAYPEDEKASKESLRFRCERAKEFFLVAEKIDNTNANAKTIIAYCCGTLMKGTKLTHESMFAHDAEEGTTLCVHSVVCKRAMRRQKVATKLLKQYVKLIKAMNVLRASDERDAKRPRLKSIRLLCKKELIAFYESCQFECLGVSDVLHGREKWFECEYVL
jgi:arylalkylamine N-acetyltransferase